MIAERNEYAAAYRLLEALGLLTVENINLDVDAYDPTAHTKKVRNKMVGDWTPYRIESESGYNGRRSILAKLTPASRGYLLLKKLLV